MSVWIGAIQTTYTDHSTDSQTANSFLRNCNKPLLPTVTPTMFPIVTGNTFILLPKSKAIATTRINTRGQKLAHWLQVFHQHNTKRGNKHEL